MKAVGRAVHDRGEYATRLGIHLQAPVIVKYRDGRTDAVSELESALR